MPVMALFSSFDACAYLVILTALAVSGQSIRFQYQSLRAYSIFIATAPKSKLKNSIHCVPRAFRGVKVH